jgi:hypothetical protein
VKPLSQNVGDFLDECRELIQQRKVDPFTNDLDTKNTLDMLGYSIRAMLQEIKELESTHLHKGPKKDKNSKYPGEIWEFKKEVQGTLLYIKLKIRVICDRKELFVMSFHPDR